MSKGNILVVDDEQSIRVLLQTRLSREGFKVSVATQGEEAVNMLTAGDYDVVVTDLRMPVLDGFALLREIQKHPELSHVQMIVITGHGDQEAAIECVKLGAFDFIEKPFDSDILSKRVQNACVIADQRKQESGKPKRVQKPNVGMRLPKEIMRNLSHIAEEKLVPVLLLGESGVGKEVVAQAIHVQGGGNSENFVALNCAAIPRELLESEIFGHEKGSFSGASEKKAGLAEIASQLKGTLFLDEIGDLNFDLQAKLLRFIQERKFRKVGSAKEQTFEGRIIAATCKNLEQEIVAKNFREDLYFRLSVLKFHLPALRERDDRFEIAEELLEQESVKRHLKNVHFSESAKVEIMSYYWPGNIRELKNVIERVLILKNFKDSGEIKELGLPKTLKKSLEEVEHRELQITPVKIISGDEASEVADLAEYRKKLIHEAEQKAFQKALTVAGGNKTKAAQLLGIDRSTLNRILKKIAG